MGRRKTKWFSMYRGLFNKALFPSSSGLQIISDFGKRVSVLNGYVYNTDVDQGPSFCILAIGINYAYSMIISKKKRRFLFVPKLGRFNGLFAKGIVIPRAGSFVSCNMV